MAAEQSDAIILRLAPFSETSVVVTAFTRELGQIAALAKGAHRPKSPFDGSLDLLSVCRLVVIVKPGDTLDILTESKLQRRFRAGGWSQLRLHCGYYLAELLRYWTSERDRSEALFDLSLQTLQAIDATLPLEGSELAPGRDRTPAEPSPRIGSGLPQSREGGIQNPEKHRGVSRTTSELAGWHTDPLWAVLRFEVRAMQILGLMPSTRLCVGCGLPVDFVGDARVPFAYDLGGVLCGVCRRRHHGVVSLRPTVLHQLDHLATDDTVGQLAFPPGDADGNLYRELRATVSRLVAATLGKVPRTQSLLPATWVSH